MGTRHLIEVRIDGQTKIAQYGQWDGYLTGAGAEIACFLEDMDKERFCANLRACRWLSQKEIEEVNATPEWFNKYRWLSRDAGAEILSYVQESPRALQDSSDFKDDPLFCEFHYLIDMDAETVSLMPSEKYPHRSAPENVPFKEWTTDLMERAEEAEEDEEDAA